MEPHWNNAKLQQVIGRAIRYQSHSDLPEKERKVDIYRWISVFPNIDKKYKTADEYLMELSIKKEIMINEFKKILIEASIEKNV